MNFLAICPPIWGLDLLLCWQVSDGKSSWKSESVIGNLIISSAHLSQCTAHQEEGSDWILGNITLPKGRSNTGTGFLEGWPMPPVHQCSGGISIVWIVIMMSHSGPLCAFSDVITVMCFFLGHYRTVLLAPLFSKNSVFFQWGWGTSKGLKYVKLTVLKC